jgi:hypothetical protein
MEQLVILGVLVQDRENLPVKLQDIFSKYGCCIKTRIGLNELDIPGKGSAGLIILELMGDKEECIRLENEIHMLPGTEVKKMLF